MSTALRAESTDVATLQRYARLAGIAMLLSIIFGFLGEMYLPGRIIVSGDATATAANITGDPALVRKIWGEIEGLGNTFIWQMLLSF